MIFIITGGIGSGKTERLLKAFKGLPEGSADGFASIREHVGRAVSGYKLKHLAGGGEVPLAVEDRFFKRQFHSPFRYDKYLFNPGAFAFGERIIRESIFEDPIRSLFIDEVGPIELGGGGFCSLLLEIIASGEAGRRDLYICVRTGCVEQVVAKFGIREYGLLE